MGDGLIIAIIFGTLIVCSIFGFLTHSLCDKKNYDGGFLWGFLLGIIGLIYCAGLPDDRNTQTKHNNTTPSTKPIANRPDYKPTNSNENYWTCENCGKKNPVSFACCHYCGKHKKIIN